MGLIKKSSHLLILILILSSTFAVKVTDNSEAPSQAVENGIQSVIATILTIGFLTFIAIVFMLLFAWLLMKIWAKLTEVKKGKNDFLFESFENFASQSHINYDKKLKKKNWKLFYIFWKRKPVFIENDKGFLECVGLYHGECYKKEGYYMVVIQNKIGMFQFTYQMILIPMALKDKIVKKIDLENNRTMIIRCEGLDTLASTDYIYMPLLRDPKGRLEFIDFSDKIHKEFIEKIVYRDMIKENLLSSRKMVIQSVETNPFVHFGRRGGENFKK
jgi:hypothetical protein